MMIITTLFDVFGRGICFAAGDAHGRARARTENIEVSYYVSLVQRSVFGSSEGAGHEQDEL
jgi:hypothetical protein